MARGLLRVAREQNATQLVVGKPVGWRALDLLRGGSLLNRLIRESGHIDIHAVRAEGEAPLLRRAGDAALRCRRPRAATAWRSGSWPAVTGLNAVLQQLAGLPIAGADLPAQRRRAGDVRRTRPDPGRGDADGACCGTSSSCRRVFTFRISGAHRPDVVLHLLRGGAGDGPPGRPPARAASRRAPPRAARHRPLPADARTGPGLRLRGPAGGHHPRGGQGRRRPRWRSRCRRRAPDGPLTPYFASTWAMAEKEQSVASWAFLPSPARRPRHGHAAVGRGLASAAAGGRTGAWACSACASATPRRCAADQRDLLDAFVRQIALVLDRQRLRDAEQQAKLVAESERLSKTLLNSISHEIRTPIAAITSAASSLSEARRRGQRISADHGRRDSGGRPAAEPAGRQLARA